MKPALCSGFFIKLVESSHAGGFQQAQALQAKLEALADSDHAATVSTWDAMPLIDKLYAAVEQLEIALEAEVRRQEDRGIIRAFFVTTSSLPTARLIEELKKIDSFVSLEM